MKALSNGACMKSILLAIGLAVCVFSAQAQKTTLVVAAYPAVDDIVKASVGAFQKAHPQVEIKVVSREYADHHTAMTTALAASSGLPDVMAIEYGYLGRFSQSGGLENLSAEPYLADELAHRFTPYAWAQARHGRQGQTAMPGDIGPGALFYRQDLLARAGVEPAALSGRWEDLIQAGQQIKTRTGAFLVAHARDVKDVVIRAGVEPGQGIYFDAQGESLVGSAPRFKRAFELARQVREAGLDARVNVWSNEWSESLRRDRVAIQMMGAWLSGHLQNWLAPETAGKWRSAPLPEGAATSWGGTFYAIPQRAQHKALAWQLLRHLTLDASQQRMALERFNAFPALREAQTGVFFDQPIAFLGGQQARRDWRDTAQRIQASRVFRHDPIADEIVNAELDLVLNRGKPIDRALADAHRLIVRRSRR
jgi:multiple sugar transport system substrate-binding protein